MEKYLIVVLWLVMDCAVSWALYGAHIELPLLIPVLLIFFLFSSSLGQRGRRGRRGPPPRVPPSTRPFRLRQKSHQSLEESSLDFGK